MKKEELVERVLRMEAELYLKPDDNILAVAINKPWAVVPLERVLGGYPHRLLIIDSLEWPGQDYPFQEKFLEEERTVAWLLTNVSASHSKPTRQMLERKIFMISNPGITPDWPALLDPTNRGLCRQNAEALMRAIGGDIGGEIHVLADDGTDLRLRVPYGNWWLEAGDRESIGTNGPFGELVTAPYWAEGVCVMRPDDFMTNPINRLKEEIRLTIKDNHVTNIEGGEQAETLRQLLATPGDKKAYCLGEWAFGLNPDKPRKLHSSVTAEKRLGGIHFALGSNAGCLREECPEIEKFQYGRYTAGVHIDCIKFGATVTFVPENASQPVILLEKGNLAVG